MKNNPSDHSTGLSRIIVHLFEIIKDTFQLFALKKKETKHEIQEIKKKFVILDNENKKITAELTEIKEYKKLEMETIQREIEEIFGKNESESK